MTPRLGRGDLRPRLRRRRWSGRGRCSTGSRCDGDETVLDAGCGSGRVTRMLLERLPRGRVVAVDSAPSMVEHAREALGDRARRCSAPTSPS